MKVGAAADIPAQIKEEDEEFDKNYELLQQVRDSSVRGMFMTSLEFLNNYCLAPDRAW